MVDRVWGAAAFVLVGLLSGAGGAACGTSADPSSGGASEAVAIDYYEGGAPSETCAGTLVSPLVVLTAAHCADHTEGARVTVAGQSADVDQVLVYDWPDDPTLQAHGHDLALLVLKSPLSAAAYADVAVDDTVATANAGKDGAAVKRPDGAVIGVSTGAHADYFGRIGDRVVAWWVNGVVYVVQHAAAQSAIAPGLMTAAHPLDDKEALIDDKETLINRPSTPGGAEGLPLVEVAGSLLLPKYHVRGLWVEQNERRFTPVSGDNYWVAKPTDPQDDAFSDVDRIANNHPNGSYLFTHGAPGIVDALPPTDTIQQIYHKGGTSSSSPPASPARGGGAMLA
jgi:hypothetical protein